MLKYLMCIVWKKDKVNMRKAILDIPYERSALFSWNYCCYYFVTTIGSFVVFLMYYNLNL